MKFEATVRGFRGDYAVLVSESGTESETALLLLPEDIEEGMTLVCEDFVWRVKEKDE